MSTTRAPRAIPRLTMNEMLKAVPHRTFNTSQRRSRAKMEEAITGLPQDKYDLLCGAATAKRRRLGLDTPSSSTQTVESLSQNVPELHPLFETVSEKCRQNCIADFIDATGSKAIATSICAVCAGTFFDSDVDHVLLSYLHESEKLHPATAHSSHVLTNDMLLHHHPSCFSEDTLGRSCANVCTSCLSLLRQHKTPPLSLANGMWIGDVPLVLRVLTLPEWILVARFFPAAYIVKLYPKKRGARAWPTNGLHSGLRGNVSTYRLNTDDIVHMTDSQCMPPSSSILAATIGVTFVGPRNLPQKTMPGFLRVNRQRVHDALLWLKTNNPLYQNIIISTTRLNKLPADDVPNEIIALAKHSDDTAQLAEEQDGYVPDDADDTFRMFFLISSCSLSLFSALDGEDVDEMVDHDDDPLSRADCTLPYSLSRNLEVCLYFLLSPCRSDYFTIPWCH